MGYTAIWVLVLGLGLMSIGIDLACRRYGVTQSEVRKRKRQ